jgi:hypothetical protein
MRRSRVIQFDASTGTVVEIDRTPVRHRPKWPLTGETMAVHPEQIEDHGDIQPVDRGTEF